MNVNSYKDLKLIKYSAVLSFFIFFNYVLWSINAPEIVRSINFAIIILIFFNFFISTSYNEYWYVKITIFLLLLASLGAPTITWDGRSIYLFAAKRLFFESNIYIFFDNYFPDGMNSFPKLPATLSASFAQLLGTWNEIFPKTTNIVIILPPILFLLSFLKEKIFKIIAFSLLLFFSGKLWVNGLMDGIIALYFVASAMAIYQITLIKNENENKIFYLMLFLFFSILSLCKNEGMVIVFVIIFSTTAINLFYEKKINYKLWLITLVSLIPIFFWKYLVIKNNIITEFVQYDPLDRVFHRVTNPNDIWNIILYIVKNEKLIISLALFIFCSYKKININNRLILFISLNFLLYFLILIGSFLLTPKDLLWQLSASSTRIYISLILLLSYFSILLIQKKISDK